MIKSTHPRKNLLLISQLIGSQFRSSKSARNEIFYYFIMRDTLIFSMLFVLLLVVVVKSTSYDNVKLEVYIESGCPVSQTFLLGELTRVLALPDVANITDFKYVPFGNSFFNKTINTFQYVFYTLYHIISKSH